jgi:hypothetical protein
LIKKLLILLTLLVCGVSLASATTAPTPLVTPKDCSSEAFKDDPECKKTEDKPSTVVISKLPTADISIQRNANRDLPDWIAFGAGILLTAVGIWGIIVARRGVIATEVAANAAKASGDAFVDAERAWILVETGVIPDDFEPDPTRLEIFEIAPVIANRGRTTGRVVGGFIAQIQPKSTAEIPPEPDYSGKMGRAQVDFVLAPGGLVQPLRVNLSAQDFVALRHGERKLYVYGFVAYSDIGKQIRESHFCFTYYVPEGYTAQKRGFLSGDGCADRLHEMHLANRAPPKRQIRTLPSWGAHGAAVKRYPVKAKGL